MPRTSLPPRAAAPRRWVLCAALLAGGFVVGGGIGTLLVIGSVFGVLDAVVPIPRSPQAEAEDRFARLGPRGRRPRRRIASPGWPARAAGARSSWTSSTRAALRSPPPRAVSSASS